MRVLHGSGGGSLGLGAVACLSGAQALPLLLQGDDAGRLPFCDERSSLLLPDAVFQHRRPSRPNYGDKSPLKFATHDGFREPSVPFCESGSRGTFAEYTASPIGLWRQHHPSNLIAPSIPD